MTVAGCAGADPAEVAGDRRQAGRSRDAAPAHATGKDPVGAAGLQRPSADQVVEVPEGGIDRFQIR